MTALTLTVIALALLAYVLGTSHRPARRRELRQLQQQWQQDVDAFLASDPMSKNPVADPWLAMMVDRHVEQQRKAFLSQFAEQKADWWRRRREGKARCLAHS